MATLAVPTRLSQFIIELYYILYIKQVSRHSTAKQNIAFGSDKCIEQLQENNKTRHCGILYKTCKRDVLV